MQHIADAIAGSRNKAAPRTVVESLINSSLVQRLFCVLLVLPSLIWIYLDQRVWSWDQSCYGQASIAFWSRLINHPSSYWDELLYQIMASRPPGIALLGQFFVPIGLAAHSIEFGLLLSILVTQCASLWLLLDIGKLCLPKNRFLPYLGCLIFASTPLFIYLSHEFLVESLQAFSVIYFYWLLANRHYLDRCQIITHLCMSSSVALLAKASSPLYCVVPGLLCLFWCFKKNQWLRSLDLSSVMKRLLLLTLSLITLVVTLTWYSKNWSATWRTVYGACFDKAALPYGMQADFISKLGAWIDISIHESLISPLNLIVPVLILAIVFVYFRNQYFAKVDEVKKFAYRNTILIVAIIQAALVFFVFPLAIGQEPRYAFAVYPSLLIVCIIVSSEIKSRIIIALITALFLYQLFIVQALGFGFDMKSLSHYSWLNIPIAAENNVLHHENDRISEIKRLITLVSPYAANNYPIICGVSYHWLNYNTLNFYASKEQAANGGKAAYFNWDAQSTPQEAIHWLKSMPKFVFITLDLDHMHNQYEVPFANKLNEAILRYVEQMNNIKRLPFKSEHGILILEKN